MSILRRITLILFGLLFMTIITVALLVPEALNSMAATVDRFASPLRIVLAIGVDLVILILLYSLVRRRHAVNQGGLVVKARGGAMLADVSTASARERVLKAVREVPDVVSAEAKLDAIDGKADIDMDVVVRGEQVNVPNKHNEIDRALRQVIVKQLGLQLANRPRVHIRLQGHDEVVAEEPVVIPPAPVVPVMEPPPPAPVMASVEPLPSSSPPVLYEPPDEDAEVSSRYGLIGRRTEEIKAVSVEPPRPDDDPGLLNLWEEKPVKTPPEPDDVGWQDEDTSPVAATSETPADEDKPASGGFPLRWRSQDFAPAEPAAPEQPAEPSEPDEEVLDNSALRQWSAEEAVKGVEPTPPTSEWKPDDVESEEDFSQPDSEPDVDLFAPFDADLMSPATSPAESTPVEQKLDALDQAAESVETKGNLFIYAMPESTGSDATLIAPLPSAPPEPEAPSTSTPTAGLYDENDGDRRESEADDSDTLPPAT